MIDFSDLALSPNESRAARNYLGLSQAQTAEQSDLPAHKLKRFETGNYVPDNEFLKALRDFYETQGYNFHDEDAPGAKAKARGDVFPAGVLGKTDELQRGTGSSPMSKPARPQSANLQFMRISPDLENDQIDRILDTIEENEGVLSDLADRAVSRPFLSDLPGTLSQAQAVSALRRLAENGLLHAALLGREVVSPGTETASASSANTIGDLMQAAFGDMLRAVVDGNKEAAARRKGREEPTEVLQALVG